MKKLAIASILLAFASTASMAGGCVTPKYIKKGYNDPGARAVSIVVGPIAGLMSLALQPLKLIGDPEINKAVKKSKCAPNAMLRHGYRVKK